MITLKEGKTNNCQGHTTDRFDHVFVRKAFIIPSYFLKRIVSWNFRDMRNLKSDVFDCSNVDLGTEKGQAIKPKVFGKWTKKPKQIRIHSTSDSVTCFCFDQYFSWKYPL